MGEHKFNAMAIAAKNAPPPQQRNVLGARLFESIEKKPTVLIVPADHFRTTDGKEEFFLRKEGEAESTWMPVPEGHTVKIAGQPIGMEDCDFVIRLVTTCEHRSGVVGAHGEIPMTIVPVNEVFRIDAKELIAQHEAGKGGKQTGVAP